MYLSKEEIQEVLSNNYIAQLTFIDDDHPCIIPITYFYDEEREILISYSGTGQKIDAMRINPSVSIGINEIEAIDKWRSVIIKGSYKEVKGADAKNLLHLFANGVKSIINKEGRSLDFINEFSHKVAEEKIPIVYTIKIDASSGRKKETN